MKKLYKKIGAVALASMIVAGGFGANKIESHALWGRRASAIIYKDHWDVSRLSKGAQIDLDYIEDFFKYEKGSRKIDILAASDNKSDMDEYIKKEYSKKDPGLLSRVESSAFYGRHVLGILDAEKSAGHNIVKVKFGDVHLLISIK